MGNTLLGEYHHFLRGPSANPSCEEETRKMSVGFHLGSSGKKCILTKQPSIDETARLYAHRASAAQRRVQ